jgi:hypothetical protein
MRWTFWVAGSNRYEVADGPVVGAAVGLGVPLGVKADGLLLSPVVGVGEFEALSSAAGATGPAVSSLTRIRVPNQPEKRSAWLDVTA